ncbi:hypothetical protein PIB30_080601 [Stylosanthes scabra]|uniref:Uncharacterized protein n=1 Tax=Stylosanthes scabra TaxID=79078 RepID=A0ABU6UR25_9FABA|nr:hypothetical protein [Stylosanthes scabra]
MEARTRRRTRRREGLSTMTLVDAEGKVRLTASGGGLLLDLVWNDGGEGGGGCEWGCGGGPEIGRGGEIGGEGTVELPTLAEAPGGERPDLPTSMGESDFTLDLHHGG